MTNLADNRRALRDYFIDERHTAGLSLQGWEVKAIRAGRAQLRESYVVARKGELFLLNSHISPLASASTHITAEPARTRKLLMKKAEIRRLATKSREIGRTLIPLNLHLKSGKVKLEVALASGKRKPDKRETIRRREWDRQKARLAKTTSRAKNAAKE
jgi:SsrA-binding protein